MLTMSQKYTHYMAGRHEWLDRDDVKFFDFIERNPEFVHDFHQLALDRIMNGKTRYSARAIMARLRWDYEVKFQDRKSPVMLNDHYTKRIAMLLVECELIPDGFFEFRDARKRKAIRDAFTMRAAMNAELV